MTTCKTCGNGLCRSNTSGLCRPCWNRSPEKLLKQAENMRRRWRDPESRERYRAAGIANLNGPGVRERALATIKERKTWKAASAAITPESRERGAIRISDTVLGHIPRELRAEYRRLTRTKRLLAAEATEIVLAQHAKDMAVFRARLLAHSERIENAYNRPPSADALG